MDSSDIESGATRAEGAGQNGRSWDAQGSLRRNAGRDKKGKGMDGMNSNDTNGTNGADEVTPLLGNGNTIGNSSIGPAKIPLGNVEDEWEGSNDFVGQPWNKTPSMYWLLPAFSLFALAFGGILVPKLNLIVTLVCRQYLADRSATDPTYIFIPVVFGSDNPQCRAIPEVQAMVSRFTLFLTIIPGILSAIMSPKIGALSDRYGRTRFMALTSTGLFLSEIVTILVANYPDTLSYKWLIAGSALDGISGSFTVGMALTHAYAADITAPPRRSVAFGYFHACLFSGIALGPLFAAFLIETTGQIITVFYVALGVHALFILWVLFIMPESVTKKRQQMAQAKHISGLDLLFSDNLTNDGFRALQKLNILAPLKILWPTGPGTSNRLRMNLVLLAAVDTIIFGVAMGAMTVTVLYIGYQFGWDTTTSSEFISLVNIVRVSALVIGLPALNYLVRTVRANRERRKSGFAMVESNSGSTNLDLYIIRFAVLFELVGFSGYLVSRTGSLFVLSGMIAALGGVGSPSLQSALTKHVPHQNVGQLLGATGLLHALARVVSPSFFNLLYAATVDTFPQTVFAFLGSFFAIAFIASWFIRPHVHFEEIDETTAVATPTTDGATVLAEEAIGGF